MDGPGVRTPPPFLFVAGFLLGLGLHRLVGHDRFPETWRPVLEIAGTAIGAASFLVAGSAIALFFRARTSVIPHRPARAFVESGPYRFTRNPMYVSLGALYLGLSLLFDVAWPLVFLPFVYLALRRFVVDREEAYLAVRFGEEYEAYRRRVRRWI